MKESDLNQILLPSGRSLCFWTVSKWHTTDPFSGSTASVRFRDVLDNFSAQVIISPETGLSICAMTVQQNLNSHFSALLYQLYILSFLVFICPL